MGSFEEGFCSTYSLRKGFAQASQAELTDYYNDDAQAFAFSSTFGNMPEKVSDALWEAAETDNNARFILGIVAREEVNIARYYTEAIPEDLLNDPIPTLATRRNVSMTVMDFEASCLKAEHRLELMRLEAARKEFERIVKEPSVRAQRLNDKLAKVKLDQV